MADAYGINWGAIEQPNILGSYLQGQQFKQERENALYDRQRQSKQDARSDEEWGLKKQAYADDRQKSQLELAQARGKTLTGVAQRLKSVAPGQRKAALDQAAPLFQASGIDPATFAELSEEQLSDQALDMFVGNVAKELQVVNRGNGGYDIVDLQNGGQPVRSVEPTYEPKYQSVSPGETIVEIPRGGGGAPVGSAGNDWLSSVAQAAPEAGVTSGYRTPERNAAVGGKPNSRHLSGEAVDLVPRNGETMGQLYARVSKLPGVRAINEGDHVHVQRTGAPQAQGGPRVVAQGAPKQEAAPSGYQWAGGQLQPIRGGPADPAVRSNSATGRKEVAALRKEFNALDEVKNFKDVSASYQQVRALAKPGATASDDIALTFSFMKMLDPGSVVREGEYALVGRAAGLDDQIIMGLQRIDQGKGLTPEIRQKLVNSAAKIMLQRRQAYDGVAGQYREIVADAGGDPNQFAPAPGSWRRNIKQPQKPAPKGAASGGWGKMTVR